MIGTSTMITQAPSVNFGDGDDDQHEQRQDGADAVDEQARSPARLLDA